MSTPEEQLATMIANMPEKTGKPLQDWLDVVRTSGLAKHGEIVSMLKTDHGMTHGFANLVAHSALNAEAKGGDDLIAAQFSGGKADQRPLYDAVEAFVASLGGDVEIAPKKTCVSFRRSKQFALAQAGSKGRLDLGVNLKGMEPFGRLEAWGGMISHRVRLDSVAALDDEVKGWLRRAYEQA